MKDDLSKVPEWWVVSEVFLFSKMSYKEYMENLRKETEAFYKLKLGVLAKAKDFGPQYAFHFPLKSRFLTFETYFSAGGSAGTRNANALIALLNLTPLSSGGDAMLRKLKIEIKSSYEGRGGNYSILGIRPWEVGVFLLEFIAEDYSSKHIVVPAGEMDLLAKSYGCYESGKHTDGEADDDRRITITRGMRKELEKKWLVDDNQSLSIYEGLEHEKEILEIVNRIKWMKKGEEELETKMEEKLLKKDKVLIEKTKVLRDRRREEQRLCTKKTRGLEWDWEFFGMYHWVYTKSQQYGPFYERRVRHELEINKVKRAKCKGDGEKDGTSTEMKMSFKDINGNFNTLHLRQHHGHKDYLWSCVDPFGENVVAGKTYKAFEVMTYRVPVERANLLIEKRGGLMKRAKETPYRLDKPPKIEKRLTLTPDMMVEIEDCIVEMPGPDESYREFFSYD